MAVVYNIATMVLAKFVGLFPRRRTLNNPSEHGAAHVVRYHGPGDLTPTRRPSRKRSPAQLSRPSLAQTRRRYLWSTPQPQGECRMPPHSQRTTPAALKLGAGLLPQRRGSDGQESRAAGCTPLDVRGAARTEPSRLFCLPEKGERPSPEQLVRPRPIAPRVPLPRSESAQGAAHRVPLPRSESAQGLGPARRPRGLFGPE
eukprot:scaffold8710_cov118-Isochrysis_galbana.AAC.7